MNGKLNDKYFASHEYYSQEYQDAVVDKLNSYRDYCESTGKFTKWQRSTQNYYGISTDGTKSSNTVTRAGDDGELIMGKINDYRNLVQNQLILITSNRPAGIAKAINSDPASLHQSRIGSGLAEYYLSQVGFEGKFYRACEYMAVNDEGFVTIDWDTAVGEDVRPDESGQMIKEGDAVARAIAPWNVCRDPWSSNFDDAKWVIYSYRINKYDLAAKYPQHAETILKAAMMPIKEIPFNPFPDAQSDQIEVFVVSHWKSAAVKDGRWSLHIPEVTLQDGPFPYADWNVYRMAQNDVMDTPFGYSNNNDILAIEEITDAMNSTIITNQLTFGVQSIVIPKGAGFDPISLGKGLTVFELDPNVIDKMRPLNFTQTAPEMFNYNSQLRRIKETFAGVSSLVRGDNDAVVKASSGSALALIQAQSIKFNSGGQRSYYHCLSRAITGLIQMLRTFANTKRVIKITGKVQAQYLQDFEFTGDDLSRISSITFEMTDPITQTVGGCLQLADNLLAKGMIKNARQYLTVARTGSLDAFTEDDEADEIAIKSENELLREGQPVQVIITENHQEHIESHMSVISSPESKKNLALVQAVTAHIMEHLNMWQGLSMTNPALLIATKQQVLPMMPGQAPMGAPLEAGQLPPGQQPPPPDTNPQPPAVQKAQEVKQPQMPMNPLTHERVQAPQ